MDATTIVMVLLLVVLVFFMFRNKRKRDRTQAELATKMVPGVEVMLTFGLYGTVVSIDDETNVAEVEVMLTFGLYGTVVSIDDETNVAEVEVSPGTIVKVHRQTLGRVVEPVVVDDATDEVAPLDARTADDEAPLDLTKPTYGERAETVVDDDRLDSSSTTRPVGDSDKPHTA
jgi:preprotein translocase subunit YajC